MKLSERLLHIIQFVKPGAVVADIGTDHALIPIFLIQQGLCYRAIAADIGQGPLEAARRNIDEAGLGERISLRLGDGLEVLESGETDTAIIAGMGGGTICGMLERVDPGEKGIRRLVLQPMGDSDCLRHWLVGHGWKISDEDLVREDRRLYEVICAEPGFEENRNNLLISLGPRLVEKKHPLLPELVRLQLSKNREIMAGLEKSSTEAALIKKQELQQRNKDLERIVGCL